VNNSIKCGIHEHISYDRADVKIMYSNKDSLTAIPAYELKL